MVATFAGSPFKQPELETLLEEGGQFTWVAGPLAKGSNLCHGTGGNGYGHQALSTNAAHHVARTRSGVRNDGYCAVPRGT